jgi:cytochrome c-type protein NapB
MMRHWMSTALLLAGALLLVAACAGVPDEEPKQEAGLAFRDAAIESVSEQELATYPEVDAGDAEKLSRTFPDAPPLIPHTTEDMLPITLEDNECLECHDPENAISPGDVPLPKTHFRHPVLGEGADDNPMAWVVTGYETRDEINGARYGCMMCHGVRSGNARVIQSTFEAIEGEPTQ